MEKLQKRGECGKLIVKDGWLMCPSCRRRKVLQVRPDTTAKISSSIAEIAGRRRWWISNRASALRASADDQAPYGRSSVLAFCFARR